MSLPAEPSPHSVASLAAEFDLLMARAGLPLPEAHRGPILEEFVLLRQEIDLIHADADAHGLFVDLRRPITEGRVEE